MHKIVWNIRHMGKLLSLHGTGGVVIEITGFDLQKVMVGEGSDSKSLFEDWCYKTWDYEIWPDVLMVLFTRWDEKNPGSERHYFEINHKAWCAKWEVSDSFANELHHLCPHT